MQLEHDVKEVRLFYIDSLINYNKGFLVGKRAFDVVSSILLIIVLSPLFLIIAAFVKFFSPGKIIYKQKRIGINCEPFFIYKFRTMKETEEQYLSDKYNGDKFCKETFEKIVSKKRVTPVGKILRKTSLDELPQLFNVLFGDMSLIGPRPVVPILFIPYDNIKRMRQSVKPGLTGNWQVNARKNNATLVDMLPYDMEYIENMNSWFDLKILIKTIPAVIKGQGAK